MRRLLLFAALALPIAAQQPQLQNGTLTTASAMDPQTELTHLQSGNTTAWLAYTVPTTHRIEDYSNDTTYLEGEHYDHDSDRRSTSTSSDRVLILLRVADHTLSNVRIANPNRKLDAGGTRVIYLPAVDPAHSIAMLQSLAERANSDRLRDGAILAVSVHQSPATVPALTALAAPSHDLALREKAAFWLSTQHGPEALPILDRFARDDKDDRFREKLTFDLTLVHQPAAAQTLIHMAHQDPAPQVRKQAQFWMAQIATRIGTKNVADDLGNTADNDPDSSIRKSAVFSLTQLPNGEGTPKLIQLAQTSKDPAVRKQAVFWLGQSSDPRALDYLTKLIQQ
ncbi:HEAT repeat domain-containing protein [Terriglobus aquaticus]|uniref:HEAT repeat domain-containing protein n=1 Tax=Terriglobus aquaticus TaxID=940139 RepID=A0ABW9KM45_9BACT|nr:HEAT repeat domain-containing protein [Terriglobus aquaticus]